MVILPIVERELRRATRQKNTYRIRMIMAVLAAGAGICFTLPGAIFGNGAGSRAGGALFSLLSFLGFALALLSGVFLAADCISVEKREGTLGLLFLTDLRGYDVVLGKFSAVGLRALYSLLAALPIMAFPLFMGGVTGGEYRRVSLSLVNALFFSLALGIMVSTFSKNGAGAIRTTFALLVLALLLAPAMDLATNAFNFNHAWNYLARLSPIEPYLNGFETAFNLRGSTYFQSLATSHLFGWLMLCVSSYALPRVWQEKGFTAGKPAGSLPGNILPAKKSDAREEAWRRECLDDNPVLWLACRHRTKKWVWLFCAVQILPAGIGFLGFRLFGAWKFAGALAVVSGITSFFAFILKLAFVFESCRFFTESRRDGALELIMSTPITSRKIVEGCGKALYRSFFWPSAIFVVFQLCCILAALGSGQELQGNPFSFSSGNTSVSIIGMRLPLIFVVAYGLAKWCFDMVAIAWVGMWLSLSVKRPSLAGLMTLGLVLILPSFICFVPSIITDVILILWARNRLDYEFRNTVLANYLPDGFGGLAAPPDKPPVIL